MAASEPDGLDYIKSVCAENLAKKYDLSTLVYVTIRLTKTKNIYTGWCDVDEGVISTYMLADMNKIIHDTLHP